MTTRTLDNSEDIVDSRDVIARIEELEGERDTWAEDDTQGPNIEAWAVANEDDAAELATLTALASEASGYASDWQYGETLIRDSYFERYAEELADDCGMIPNDLKWPLTCIDWAQATRELQQDYTTVEWDGVTYWVRSC